MTADKYPNIKGALVVNMMRYGALTKNQAKAIVDHAFDGTLPDAALFPKPPERDPAIKESLTTEPLLAGWRPIESAPKDGTRILVSWPMRVMDDEGFPNGKLTHRHTLITEWHGGYWLEPEVLNASGEYFGDEDCFTENPDLWQPLPPKPLAAAPEAP